MSDKVQCDQCGAVIVSGSNGCRRCQLSAGLSVPKGGSAGEELFAGISLPLDDPEGETQRIDSSDVQSNTTIGRYRLLEQLGEGGFGEVWLAEQKEPVRRRVALKIIKLGMDSKQVVARFEAERQALALMDHPNIAKVFDGGITALGRPFFVMELVRGIPITAYCDQEKLTTPQRLEIFIEVCQAIQHAHQKGIIHRDVKPSNILVTLQDGKPVPKVIDFGIAKATRGGLTEKTLLTESRQFMGTPAYMSPEQAELTSLDIDTRTDIYSLGVLLYEMLTSMTPFDAKELLKVGMEEMCRTIREREPLRPSTRLLTLDVADSTSIARCRSTEVMRLSHMVRGDLDWIVMKCLEKSRNRRYETANGLAADVRRHLQREPVVARPPSTFYRVQRAIQRNRLPFAMAGATALALLALLVASVVLTARATRAEHQQRMLYQEANEARIKEARQRQQAEEDRARAEALRLEARQQSYAADIGLATARIRDGNYNQARQMLSKYDTDSTNQDVRGFEWYMLMRQSLGRQEHLIINSNDVKAIALSPDGQSLISGDAEGRIRIYRAPRWSLLTNWPAHKGAVYSVAWSHDGALIASAGRDQVVRLWASDTGVQVRQVDISTPGGLEVKFCPRRELLAISTGLGEWGGSSGQVSLFQPRTGELLASWGGGCCVFSPDGKLFAHGLSPGGHVLIHHLDSELDAPPESLADVVEGNVVALAFDDASSRLHALTFNGIMTTWNRSAKNQNTWEAPVIEKRARQARSVIDTRLGFGIGIENGEIDWRIGSDTYRLFGHGGMIYSLAVHPHTNLLFSLSGDRTIRIWRLAPSTITPEDSDPAERAMPQLFKAHIYHEGLRPLLSPDGRTLWTRRSGDQAIISWNPTSAAEPNDLGIKGDPLAFVRKHDLLIAREVIKRGGWRGIGNEGDLLLYRPNGEFVKTLSLEPIPTKVFDGQGNVETNVLTTLGSVSYAAASHDGHRVAFGTLTGQIVLAEADSWQLSAAIIHEAPVIQAMAFSPDDRVLVTSSREPELSAWVWEVPSMRPKARLAGHSHRIKTIAFSPDGARLATGSFDHHIRIWDTKNWTNILTLDAHLNGVVGLAFSADGRTLASAGDEGSLKLWNLATGRELFSRKLEDNFAQYVAFLPNHAGLIIPGPKPGSLITLLAGSDLQP